MSTAAKSEPARMTLRVSRDNGKTFGPRQEVRANEPWNFTMAYPPCQCPRCAK